MNDRQKMNKQTLVILEFLLWLKTHYTFKLTSSHTHQFYEIHFQNQWKNHVFQKEFCHQICIQTTLPAPVCSVAEERSSEAKDFCQDGLQPGSWIPPCWILPWHWSDLFAIWVSWLVKKVMSATSPENWIKLLQKSETWVEFLNVEIWLNLFHIVKLKSFQNTKTNFCF